MYGKPRGLTVKQGGGIDEEVLVISSTTWIMVGKEVFRGHGWAPRRAGLFTTVVGRVGRRYLECGFFRHLVYSPTLQKPMRQSWYFD